MSTLDMLHLFRHVIEDNKFDIYNKNSLPFSRTSGPLLMFGAGLGFEGVGWVVGTVEGGAVGVAGAGLA